MVENMRYRDGVAPGYALLSVAEAARVIPGFAQVGAYLFTMLLRMHLAPILRDETTQTKLRNVFDREFKEPLQTKRRSGAIEKCILAIPECT